MALVRRLGASCHALVFDWDQTLCSTKSGAAPVIGRHKLQPELQTLLPSSSSSAADGADVVPLPSPLRCCVATRNSHGPDIEAFLSNAGVAVKVRVKSGGVATDDVTAGMPVRCVNAEGRTKADVALEMLEGAPEGAVVVMVDDDLRELVMDEKVYATPGETVRVHRVFFSPRELG